MNVATEIGTQFPQPDPRGVLVFTELPDALQNAEDSTQAADYERSSFGLRRFTRPATDTERLLLAHLGYIVPAELSTIVTYITTGVRNRSWPNLAQEA